MELMTPRSRATNPFAAAGDGDPFFAAAAVTAPPSPNPFELAPPGSVSDADPFDLFQHFTSAPASPARAAAIYAQFDGDDGGGGGGPGLDDKAGDDDGGGFQPRVSYSTSTVNSTVPFEWEEKPGKPKPEFAAAAAAADGGEADDSDFDFGVLLDKAAQAQELTTADELFDEGKIRPLKPPPRLLDGGSVGSSPRSARSAMWSPRLRSRVGAGSADFDPFAAALAKAAKAPSPLGAGAKDDAASSPKNTGSAAPPTSMPPAAASNGGRKKWRLSDLLLFRRVSAKGRAAGDMSTEPVFKYAPVQQLATPVKNAIPASAAANGGVSAAKHKKQRKKATATATATPVAECGSPLAHRQSAMGCVRLHPGLHRLAKGFNGHSVHLGRRGAAASATKG